MTKNVWTTIENVADELVSVDHAVRIYRDESVYSQTIVQVRGQDSAVDTVRVF